MANSSKRMRAAYEGVDREKLYDVNEAIKLVKDKSTAKFDESVDVAINLGVNARKSDQNVRGSTVLPKGTGKTTRVAVFTSGDNVDIAKAAGADIVGMDDLAEDVKQGNIDFDLCIATPDAMRVVGQLGQILGPKGIMPNPKVGTVTTDVQKAVTDAKAGQVQYRIDKAGIVHSRIGKVSFSPEDLLENLNALITALIKSKPATAKGQYIRRVAVSSSMGPGLSVDRLSIAVIK